MPLPPPAPLTELVESCVGHSPESGNSLMSMRVGLPRRKPRAAKAGGVGRRVSCVEQVVHLTQFLRLPRKILAGRPFLLMFLVALLAISAFFTVGVAAWLSYDVTAGLPKREAINGLGDMAQSTTIL